MRGLVVSCLILALASAASLPTPIEVPCRSRYTSSGPTASSRVFTTSWWRASSTWCTPLPGLVIWVPNSQQSVCGSSLVSSTRVITAAHCWFDTFKQAERFTVVMGSLHVFYGGVRVDTDNVVMHPGWNPSQSLEHDIAVVSFDAIDFTDVIQPIALPSGTQLQEDFAGQLAYISGWGITAPGSWLQLDQVQSHVQQRVMSNDECRQHYPASIVDSMLCTGFVGSSFSGVCSSDSGGPLSLGQDDDRILIGVISFADGTCSSHRPSGYARVTYYMTWLLEHL